MSIMDSNHNIECGICGYRFKTLSKIEEHYHDYDLCEELVYYPDPKDSNPPHLVENWICDKCFRRIGDAVKDNMIKDANDFVNDLNTRIEAIEREYKAKIDKEKEETEKVNNCIKELEGLKNLSDMSEDLHDTIERMPYFVFKPYYSFSSFALYFYRLSVLFGYSIRAFCSCVLFESEHGAML